VTDFDEHHRRPLHQALAAPYARELGPIAFRVPDGRAYTFVPGDEIEVRPGVEGAATIVDLPLDQWEAFADERWTRYGLLYHGSATYPVGSFDDLCRWEPVLRALLDGRPVWDPARLDLPTDLTRTFALDERHAERADFLQTAGYLHVRDVFDATEVDALRAEVEALAAGSTPDATTWWTRTPDGRDVVCQVKYGALRSQPIADLHDDARIRRILAAAGTPGLRANLDRNEGTKVIYKRPGASEGLTDLPLHTDCGMGYHPIACPMVLLGVHLDAGTPASGQLHMLPGSHNTTTPDPAVVDTSDWPLVALATQPGDVTVHFGHTLHAAPPPTGAGDGRRTFYLAFAPDSLFDALEPMEDLVAAMQGEGGITRTVDQVRY
jgi:ectoine hydroxylase-related dioxygenase (phytanoyl-CoA dioxygenase family)